MSSHEETVKVFLQKHLSPNKKLMVGFVVGDRTSKVTIMRVQPGKLAFHFDVVIAGESKKMTIWLNDFEVKDGMLCHAHALSRSHLAYDRISRVCPGQ